MARKIEPKRTSIETVTHKDSPIAMDCGRWHTVFRAILPVSNDERITRPCGPARRAAAPAQCVSSTWLRLPRVPGWW